MSQQKKLEFEASENEVVAKANELVRARHNFSVNEQRIFISMIAKLDRDMDSFPMQSVRIKDICDISGADESAIFRRIDEITDALLEKTVEIRQRDETGQTTEFKKYNVFSTCEYKRGSGRVRAQFNDNMRPYLLQLKKRFTLYLAQVFLRLDSKYSSRIYELLKMREDLREVPMTMEEFRRTLSL